jgi:hypothetical protein
MEDRDPVGNDLPYRQLAFTENHRDELTGERAQSKTQGDGEVLRSAQFYSSPPSS